MRNIKIIYQDKDLIVFDKPAGINCDDFSKRIHRLDKDTSGIFLVAKNEKALSFFQKQFKERKVSKKYLSLISNNLKNKKGTVETLLGRSQGDRRKQKAYLPNEPEAEGKRMAITKYKVLQSFKDYDLIEAEPVTGRKHQIRAHFTYLGHPIAGDKMYSFKNQPKPLALKRQFLHANYIKVRLPNGKIKEFQAELSDDLKQVLKILNTAK